jgi:hypothetical protein
MVFGRPTESTVAVLPRLSRNLRIGILVCLLGSGAGPLFGQVRMLVREGLPIVDGVYVNGHGPYRFLVDTGANINLIEASLARSAGLTATLRMELASSTGIKVVPGSDGNDVRLDSIHAERQKFLFLRLEVFRDRWPDIQGVLGQWFLSGMDYTLDLRGKRLAFGKQEPSGTRTPFRIINGRQAVSTSLGDLILDSAAERLVLFGVKPETALRGAQELLTFTGSQGIGMVSNRPLTIDGRKVWHGAAVAIPNGNEPGVGGLLPLRMFKSIYFCNSEGYVVFE